MNINAGTVGAPASKRIRLTQPFKLVSVLSSVRPRTVGVPSYLTSLDQEITRITGTTVTDYQCAMQSFGGLGIETPAWTSSSPSVGTVDASGLVTFVSNGSTTITATVLGLTKTSTISLFTTVGTYTDTVTGYITGSLAANATNAVDSRLAGKTAATAMPIFSVQDHAAGTYVRNTNCWCADIDLTCMSPWNSVGGNNFAGTLISPRHVLFAAHYGAPVGTVMRFVKADNTVVSRTITAALTHPSFVPYYPDLYVAVLDSDVGAGISFAKILPASYTAKLPSLVLGSSRTLPSLCLDQEEKALVTDLVALSGSAQYARATGINAAKRNEFYEDKIGGDSGNPAFLIINNELVLTTVWTYGGAGSGTFVTAHIDAVNTMMTTLGGGYQLTQIDLSSFPSY